MEATRSRPYDMSIRSQRSAATADRIRDLAWERFSTRSYDEVTLAEIAEAAGVSVPTVRSHFGHKEDLFLAGYVAWGMRAVQNREGARQADPIMAIRQLLKDYERQGEVALHLLAEEDRFPAVKEMTDGARLPPLVARRGIRSAPLAADFRDPRATPRPALPRHRLDQLEAPAARSRPFAAANRGGGPGEHPGAAGAGVMARILLYMSPSSGHTFPPVPTALELAARGHEVVVRSGAAGVAPLRAAGLETAVVDPRIEAIEVDDWRASNPLSATRRLFAAFARRAEFELPDCRRRPKLRVCLGPTTCPTRIRFRPAASPPMARASLPLPAPSAAFATAP